MNSEKFYSDFYKFATTKRGVNGLALDQVKNQQNNLLMPSANYNQMNPTIIEERQLNIASMDVFSRLMMDRIIFLGTEIDDYVSNVITAQLLYLSSTDSSSDIAIYVNSPGGSVSDGLAIYDTMQYIDNDISTICTGMAASMGSIILCAGTPGKRSALKHSRVMIHQPWGATKGQASDIKIEAQQILKLKNELCEILSTHSGQSMKKVIKDCDRNYWMTANEAKEYGMIDDIYVNPKKIIK